MRKKCSSLTNQTYSLSIEVKCVQVILKVVSAVSSNKTLKLQLHHPTNSSTASENVECDPAQPNIPCNPYANYMDDAISSYKFNRFFLTCDELPFGGLYLFISYLRT